jgi:hypothetical protein
MIVLDTNVVTEMPSYACFAVATRDVDPFLAAGVPVINPWEE